MAMENTKKNQIAHRSTAEDHDLRAARRHTECVGGEGDEGGQIQRQAH